MKNPSRSVLVALVALGLLLAGSTAFAAQVGCVVNNINGTISIDPPGCSYSGPGDLIHGQGDLSWDPIHASFTNVASAPHSVLGGEISTFDSEITIRLTGNGPLEGYEGSVTIPAKSEAHAGPWTMEDKPISFDTEMMRLEGQLERGTESDFSYLRVVAGTEYGYPSPGHTTATTQDGETYVVDSMFEMGFRIEYVGAPGGPLEGYEGAFEGTAVMKAFADPDRDAEAEAEAAAAAKASR